MRTTDSQTRLTRRVRPTGTNPRGRANWFDGAHHTSPSDPRVGIGPRLLIVVIKVYQWTLSPLLGPCCRFYPSCSAYSIEAIREHGSIKGVWLGVKRIAKCHPWHPGGVDLVPCSHANGGKPTELKRHE